jgi:HEAT repeat protein
MFETPHFSWQSMRPLARRFRRWARHLAQAWRARRQAASEYSESAAVAALADPHASRRWEACAILGRSSQSSPAALAALASALTDPEPFVRWQAAEALGAQEPGNVFTLLRSLITDSTAIKRAGAVTALGRMGGEGACLEVRRVVADDDSSVRLAACEALARCADPTSAKLLVPLLRDPDVAVASAAAHALGILGTPAVACDLAAVLSTPGCPLLLRRALAAALAHAPHPETQETLLSALADADPQVRAYAAKALGGVGDDLAYQALSQLREDNSTVLSLTVADHASRAMALIERRGRRGSTNQEAAA